MSRDSLVTWMALWVAILLPVILLYIWVKNERPYVLLGFEAFAVTVLALGVLT